MNPTWIVIVPVLLACTVRIGAADDQGSGPLEQAVQTLVRDIQEMADENSASKSAISVTLYLPFNANDREEEEPGPDWPLAERREFEWLAHGGRFALEGTTTYFEPAGADPTPFDWQVVWNGAAWYRCIPADKSILIRPDVRCGYATDCLWLFNGLDGPSFLSRDSIANCIVLEDAWIIEYQAGVSESLTERLVVGLSAEPLSTLDLWVRRQPRIGIERAILRVYGDTSAADGPKIKLELAYRVHEWQESEGLYLPARATRRTVSYVANDDAASRDNPGISVVEFRRTKPAVRIAKPVDESTFSIELTSGYRVEDERSKLLYEIGGYELWMDGTQYRTVEPIPAEPLKNLQSLLANASASVPVIEDVTAVDKETHLGKRVALSVALGALVFVVVMGVHLMRQGRR